MRKQRNVFQREKKFKTSEKDLNEMKINNLHD